MFIDSKRQMPVPSEPKPVCSQAQFFEVIDLIEPYDRLLTELNTAYTQAMVELSYLRFQNQDSSVTTKGFKPTPALFRLNQQYQVTLGAQQRDQKKPAHQQQYNQQQINHRQGQLKIDQCHDQQTSVVSKSIIESQRQVQFDIRVQEQEQDYEEQKSIQKQINQTLQTIKISGLQDQLVRIQTFKALQETIIDRFNVLNNRTLIRSASLQFFNFLMKCLQVIKARQLLGEALDRIQMRKKGQFLSKEDESK